MTLPDLIDLLTDVREARFQRDRARALADFYAAKGL